MRFLKQNRALLSVYAAMVVAALVMLKLKVGGLAPGLMLIAVPFGLLLLGFQVFRFPLGHSLDDSDGPTPPEPDYIRSNKTP